MEDEYGRIINYMRISITDRCNLRCRYCMPNGIKQIDMKEILTYEEIQKVVTAAAKLGITKFKVTGGEPLIRLGCAEFIGRLKNIPGVEQVTMTTNGVLLCKYLDKLVEQRLDAVNISLDTLTPEIYKQITGFSRLSQVIEGIKQALDRGLKVKLNVVLQRGVNDKEWLQLIRLGEDNKLDVRFIEMMPIGYGKEYESVDNEFLIDTLYQLYPNIELEKQDSIKIVHGNGPATYYHIPGFKGSVGFISAIHGKFCKNCNRIRLTSQGLLKPCLCYAKYINLKDILRSNIAAVSDTAIEYELQRALKTAISMKPEGHCFEEKNQITEWHQMVQIGG